MSGEADDTAAEPRNREEQATQWAHGLGPVTAEGGRPLSRRRLARLRHEVERATQHLRQSLSSGAEARAAEWLLDNAWLVQRTIDLIEESLPRGFCRQLPATRTGFARIEVLARQVVAAESSWIEAETLRRWVDGVQRVGPLTIGELWALPAMVRLALVEDLSASASAAAGLPRLVTARDAETAPPPDPLRLPACVQSLRAFEQQDWNRFFEATSVVESILRRDPAGAYGQMSFESRDRYRRAVEDAARTGRPAEKAAAEVAVAEMTVRLCGHAASLLQPRLRHVGFWLVEAGRPQLEQALEIRPAPGRRLRRWLRPAKVPFFLAIQLIATAVVTIACAAPALGSGPLMVIVALALCALPASAVAVAAVQWLVACYTEPRALPKLEIDGPMPAEAATMIVVPAMLGDRAEIESVLRRAETNWLGNADAVLGVALLFDYVDAPQEVMPEDQAVMRLAVQAVDALNLEHGSVELREPFLLLIRERTWSESEQQWMGWERKRGKLQDFDRLVLGESSQQRVEVGDPLLPSRARFAITLDADTILPPETARCLIGTLAHPLNRPVFDASGRVVAGYTVLQPRVDIAPWSVGASPFSSIFSGERGLDLYSRAASDFYQDLFGEGIFVGKGIYVIEAFHRSLEGRVPEGSLLSHDLFEGLHGRAGLISDVAVLEEFPSHPVAWLRRRHRWIRGDWQIAPWLVTRPDFSMPLLGRWKIADNLRRSVVAPALVALLVAGWTVLPGAAWWWTVIGMLVPGLAFAFGTLSAARSRLRPGHSIGTPREWILARVELARWALALALLPYQGLQDLDAVGRAVYRMTVTRRHLLQWTPAYRTERLLRQGFSAWRDMASAPLFATAIGTVVAILDPLRLSAAGPLLAAWIAAPFLVDMIARLSELRPGDLDSSDRWLLRRVARRTWSFFEHTLRPDDHWLPPDHVQEAPSYRVARRTSPTNIGLTATAALSAWDFGYLSSARLVAIVKNLFDTLDDLEKFRGHFLNWYDTQRLTSLPPRYVSTVDSGNLACALVALARGLEALVDLPLPRLGPESEGLIDAIEAVRESVERRGWEDVDDSPLITVIEAAIVDIQESSGAAREWRQALDRVAREHVPNIESRALEIAESSLSRVDQRDLTGLRERLRELRHQAEILRHESAMLLPWLEMPPELSQHLPAQGVALGDVPRVCSILRDQIGQLTATGLPDPDQARQRLDEAQTAAQQLTGELADLVARADRFSDAMEFAFLYDDDRQLFRIGYDVDAGRYDASWYDLLASEARAASFFAIATGAVPVAHWLHLGRPFVRTGGRAVMLSWAGTLFEYLMPGLFLRQPPGSLLDLATRRAIQRQMRFGRRHRIPWGISESGYHELDADGGYRYRAFGLAELALRRELEGRIVVAPYASCLAAAFDPVATTRNIEHLVELGMLGPHGLYEALDFGASVNRQEVKGRIVRSCMAHHQAMVLVAIGNALHQEVMVERFLSDARMQAAGFLLYEHTPERVPVQSSFPAAKSEPPPRALQPIDVGAWGWATTRERPRVQVLSNGRWSTLISDRGSGGARVEGLALTRWRADPTSDTWGTWIYLQDLESGALWSATERPTWPSPTNYQILFAPHAVELHRHELGIFSRLIVCVTATTDIEIRQIYLRNDSSRTRRLGVCSFGEVALARQSEDRRHPAFGKLFVKSRFDAADQVLFFRRRGAAGTSGRLAHAVNLPPSVSLVGWESDRGRFLGRGGNAANPSGLRNGPSSLSRTTGATLDPAFSLGCEVELAPGDATTVTYLTAFGSSEADVLVAMDGLRTPERIDWAIEQARAHTAMRLAHAGVTGHEARQCQALLCSLVYPCAQARAAAVDESERPRQSELWAIGVSGDDPVLLLRVARPAHKAETLAVLRAHAWLRSQKVRADLVVLDSDYGGYADPLHGWLQEAVADTHGAETLGRNGGVHYLPLGRLDALALSSIEAAAAAVLDTAQRGLDGLLEPPEPDHLPPFATFQPHDLPDQDLAEPPAEEALIFEHRRGGLSVDGKDYVVRVDDGRPTPAPWSCVIANRDFGFLITERGGGFTYSQSSSERRLTPWSNDPVLDPPGEVLYIRDEETGDVWSATPAPAGAGSAYRVRFTAGMARFEHRRAGLEQHLRLFTADEAPVKISRLEVSNLWQRQRRLTVTYFVEWTLGNHRDLTGPHLTTELATEVDAILARERFSQEYAGRFAVVAASERLHGFTADRSEFLGRGGSGHPSGLSRIGLAGAVGPGLDACGALQVHIDLEPGESRSLQFMLGDAEDRDAALALARAWRSPEKVERAEAVARGAWDERLSRLVVHTPEPSMDAMVNRWLPYQALVSRLWARSAFYQSSGAFGFRDQLQDALAFLTTDPAITRRQILECASRQFTQGDVLHWWHPPEGAGTRTRCTDDLVWLPYAIAAYVESTADGSILEVEVPFLTGAQLAPTEEQRYDHFPESPGENLYEHGRRALERAWTSGRHGLPLIGGGDWNDGMDRVGAGGRGESVWLGWFLLTTARAWAPLCERVEGPSAVASWLERADILRRAIEQHAWDGEWYRRAYYDDGTPLGTAEAEEARIDSISQSWAVLSAAADPARANRAVESAMKLLVRPQDRLALLLDPPFDRTPNDPGYIKAYPPGVRENGGQYTHAAIWLSWALAELGDGDRAEELFRLLNPLLRSATESDVERYRVEPYVVAADIYGAPPHVGRGGWTWYTGSAGWLWRLGTERILGIRRSAGRLVVDPCIPRHWPGFHASVRIDDVEAQIRVDNPDRVCRGVVEARLDGRVVEEAAVPLGAPGHHVLSLRLGRAQP